MSPKISIIMPVYNADRTVSRMIDSIRVQTFQDWELLCVDDGSTDNSGRVLDEYAAKDPRIHVIHKTNGGVSAARQLGLDNASGEYTIHADSDDWVEPDMLEELYKKAEKENADVIICDFYSDMGEQTTYVSQCPSAMAAETVLRDLFQQLHGSCCNKLTRQVCYKQYNVKFPIGINHCEDLLTWVQLFQHPVKIAYLPHAFYHYVQNEDSITRHFTRRTYETRRAFYLELCRLLPAAGFDFEKRKVRLGILSEGYMYGVVSNGEAWAALLKHNKKAAFCETHSWRWRIGYLCLALGIFPVAKRLLSY